MFFIFMICDLIIYKGIPVDWQMITLYNYQNANFTQFMESWKRKYEFIWSFIALDCPKVSVSVIWYNTCDKMPLKNSAQFVYLGT